MTIDYLPLLYCYQKLCSLYLNCLIQPILYYQPLFTPSSTNLVMPQTLRLFKIGILSRKVDSW